MLTIFLGALVGLSLGLTGGGGSLFAVPLLIYVLGVQPHLATTISLAAVASMAAFGAIEASINKMVEWRASLIFVIGGITCAPFGVKIAGLLSENIIITCFAILMLIIAALMWYRATKQPADAAIVRVNYIDDDDENNGAICKYNDDQIIKLSAPCSVILVISGGITGVLSGLFGVGGGFLIVPALTFITQLNIHRAVASSLLVISLIGLSGVSAAVYQGRLITLDITGLFILGGLVGMIIGRLTAKRIPSTLLQKVFSLFILITATAMLIIKT